jgi:pyruvate dehydrogenase (quinone)
VALAGDGAMQMNGVAELITVADRWTGWADPRFVVLRAAQRRPGRGQLGAARDGGRPALRRLAARAGVPVRRLRRAAGAARDPARRPGRRRRRVGRRPGGRPTRGAGGRGRRAGAAAAAVPGRGAEAGADAPGLEQDGPAGARGRRLLDEQARQERDLR